MRTDGGIARGEERLAPMPVVIVTAVAGDGGDPGPFRKFISTRRQVPPPEAFFSEPIDRPEFSNRVATILDV